MGRKEIEGLYKFNDGIIDGNETVYFGADMYEQEAIYTDATKNLSTYPILWAVHDEEDRVMITYSREYGIPIFSNGALFDFGSWKIGADIVASECIVGEGHLWVNNSDTYLIDYDSNSQSPRFPQGFTITVDGTDKHITDVPSKAEVDAKQDALTAGEGIKIEGNVISATGGSAPEGEVDITLTETSISDGTVTLDISGKQDTLTAGTGINIVNNVVSATGISSVLIDVGSYQTSQLGKVFPAIKVSKAKEIYSTFTSGKPVIVKWTVMGALPIEAMVLGSDNVSGDTFDIIMHNEYLCEYNYTSSMSDDDYATITVKYLGSGTSISEYVKNAEVSGDKLVLTKQDDTTVEFQGGSAPEGEVDITLTETSISDGTTTLDISGKQDKSTLETDVSSKGFIKEETVNTRLDGLTFKRLTQSAYDALTTKDANTFYIIVEE